jgi:hypothetical protein
LAVSGSSSHASSSSNKRSCCQSHSKCMGGRIGV